MKTLIIFSYFFWSGIVFAISFVESPLKFKSPLVTEKIGLSIGQLVFHAQNKIEWILSILVIISLFALKTDSKIVVLYLLPSFILVTQTIILYGVLDPRVESILQGITVQKSNAHLVYIILELLKFIFLLISGIRIIKS